MASRVGYSIVGMAVTVLGGSAGAQVIRGEVSIGAGVATDQRGVRSSAVSVAPSVTLSPGSHFTAAVAASGTQFGAAARALGVTGILGGSLPLGDVVALAASASGGMTHTNFNATYTALELTPTVEATWSRATLFVGTHVSRGSSRVAMASVPGGGVVGSRTVQGRDSLATRTSAGAVFGGVVRLGSTVARTSALGYREEHARVNGVRVVDRAATSSLANGSAAIAASVGLRSAADEHAAFGTIATTVAVRRGIALQASAGTYPSNRITGALGGRYATVGLLLHGLRALPTAPTAAVRGAPPVPQGATRLVLRAAKANRVEVAGDWNGWTPVPTTRAADGAWYADVRLARGEYRYAFRIDGRTWSVPEGVPSLDDGFGGQSAVVSVR